MINNCENARAQYLTDNPDVKNANMDPLSHYTVYGMKEGRKWKNELCSPPAPTPTPAPAPDPNNQEQPEILQFIINDESLNDDKQTIITDLYTAIIYLNQFSKTQTNGGHIKIPYAMPSGTMRPNVTYMANVDIKKYKCKNLHIFKATHKINMDASFDAELVIELVPTVNTSEKLYLCFLLTNTRYTDREPNDIDKIIKTSIKPPMHYDTMNFNMQKLIEPQQKKIIYKSGIDTIVIFVSPISINEVDFSVYDQISEGLFAMYPVNKDYKIILPPKIEDTKTEGFTTEESDGINSEIIDLFNKNLITCTPVDDNDKSTVKGNTATYLIDGNRDAATAQTALGTAFFIILVAIGTSYLGGPLFYQYTIANFIKKEDSLSLFTIFITAMIFLLGINLLIGGQQYDSNEMWIGMFIIIFLLLSSLSIALDRSANNASPPMASFSDTMSSIRTIIPDMLYNFWYIKDTTGKDVFDKKYVGIFSGIYVIMITILSSITGTLDSNPSVKSNEKKTKGYTAHLKNLIFSVGAIYGFIFLMWIIMAIKYST